MASNVAAANYMAFSLIKSSSHSSTLISYPKASTSVKPSAGGLGNLNLRSRLQYYDQVKATSKVKPQVSPKSKGTASDHKVGLPLESTKDQRTLTKQDPRLHVDPFLKDGNVYTQIFKIRSYETGVDGRMSMETLMNHLMESALNNAKSMGFATSGFARTPEMCKRDLIWACAKMQVMVDYYPSRDDVIEVTTWFSNSGKNGVQSKWLIYDAYTGRTCARATSLNVMMNKKTRKLSKIPEEARPEMEAWLAHWDANPDSDSRRLPKFNETTTHYVHKGLTPRWSDLDVNEHVNNVNYIAWILKSTPISILENYVLAGVTLEFKRECKRDSVVQSMTAVSTQLQRGHGSLEVGGELECHHLLRFHQDEAEVAKGRTLWRPKRFHD